MSKTKPKFLAGQVVMITDDGSFSGLKYPVKLLKTTRIHSSGESAWFDTCHNVELESKMRPLTARERGEGRAKQP